MKMEDQTIISERKLGEFQGVEGKDEESNKGAIKILKVMMLKHLTKFKGSGEKYEEEENKVNSSDINSDSILNITESK